MSFMRSLLRVAVIVLCLSTASSVPASPIGRIYDQPDGSQTPLLYLRGDENNNRMADEMGYTVMQDLQGWWVYSKKKDGSLVSSGVRVGYGNARKLGLTKDLQPDQSQRHDPTTTHKVAKDHRDLLAIPSTALCNFQGTQENPCILKALVLLVRFSDHDARLLPTPQEYFMLFNNIGPATNDIAPTGSVADVFRVNSYGKFILESTITPWIRVNRTEAQTAGDDMGSNRDETRATWREAMEILDSSGFDFNLVDMNTDSVLDCLVILHSGAAAEIGGNDCESNSDYTQRVWSRFRTQTWFTSVDGISNYRFYVASGVWGVCPTQGAGTKWGIARIAVIAHECAHFLGLPDLYYSGHGNGVGNFDLLANMWGWYGTQNMPPLMGAWTKYKLRWANVVHITSSGGFQIGPSCTDDTIYLIDHNMPEGEYFLIENRYPCSFDADLMYQPEIEGMDRNGAAIWHIDESGVRGNAINYQSEGYPGDGVYPALHYEVALVQADGNWDLEKGMNLGDSFDLFRRSKLTPQSKTAYKIGPNGLQMNDGTSTSSPNTNSYAHGYPWYTGITIEFGIAAATMTMIVTLEGVPAVDTTPSPTSNQAFATPTTSPKAQTSSPTGSPSSTEATTVVPTLGPSLMTPSPSITIMPLMTPTTDREHQFLRADKGS